MCGICGTIDLNLTKTIDKKLLKSMCYTLNHRGPDDEGFYLNGPIGMAMKRLSIIDVVGGKQPISNEDRSIWIVFNGEIYNFVEIRNDLIKKGHRFLTKSDTETMVHLYEEVGIDFVNYLNGMFGVAIWDENRKELIIARDRLGIKPLFYGENNGQFYFASEIKGILADNSFPREINDVSMASYFSLAYIPAPLTIFKNIKKLPPGHILRIKNKKIQINKYWDVDFNINTVKNESEFIEEFMHILEKAVKLRMISEVPLGAFLSGGVDSSTVVALMSRVSEKRVRTFSIGFGGDTKGFLDERKYAEMVARQYNTRHRDYEVHLEPEGMVEKIVQAFDEPFADDSAIPSYYVCKIARENVTVCLSGLGGDEMFSGYERHLGFALSKVYEKVPDFIKNGIIRKVVEKIPERADGHYTVNHMKRFVRSVSLPSDLRYFGYISMLNDDIKNTFFSEPRKFFSPFHQCQQHITSHFNAPNADDDMNRLFFCEIKNYLPEEILALTDRMSMQHSLEVRVPFLDHNLVEFCATIPPAMKMKRFRKKYLLKKAVRHLLPSEVVNHRKQGFGSPMSQWLHKDLKTYVIDTLSEKNIKKHGIFNKKTVDNIISDHISKKEIHDKLIWSLVIFQTWYDMYIK